MLSARPPLRRKWVHAVFEVLAPATFGADRGRLPGFAQRVPDASSFSVARSVLAVCYVSKGKALHALPVFELSALRVLEGPGAWRKISYNLESFQHEPISSSSVDFFRVLAIE